MSLCYDDIEELNLDFVHGHPNAHQIEQMQYFYSYSLKINLHGDRDGSEHQKVRNNGSLHSKVAQS